MTTATATANPIHIPAAAPSRGLQVSLWVFQILLGLLFATTGVLKATQPIAELVAQMPWVTEIPVALVRGIGVLEFLGAIGLILPAATRIAAILTPLAALGLMLLMGLAAAFHVSRGEFSSVPINLVLGTLAGFVAWGRFTRARVRVEPSPSKKAPHGVQRTPA